MKTFKERITTLCKSKDITIDLEKDDAINQIIDGTLPIDNTDKKVRLNVDWVFYLLGECCNESLGMKIKGLDIITTTIVPVVPVIPDLPPVVTYESSTHIAGRNLSSGMKVGSYGENGEVNFGLIRTEKRDGSETVAGSGNDEPQDTSTTVV